MSKGGFVFDSDAKRKTWRQGDIPFKSWNVMHMQLDRPLIIRMILAKATQCPAITRASKSGRPIGTV